MDFPVWPENWEAVILFTRLSTQWLVSANGVVLGLNYPGVETVLRLAQVKQPGKIFEQLQTMELAARAELNRDLS